MQLLALFLLAVSAGALPQSENLSPSHTLTPTTTPIHSPAPSTHQKRDHDYPTLGNFDDHKCHGTHLGTKLTVTDIACVQFAATNKYIDIYWGSSLGLLEIYSDGSCGTAKPTKTIYSDGHGRKCISVAKLGGTVRSVKFPILNSNPG